MHETGRAGMQTLRTRIAGCLIAAAVCGHAGAGQPPLAALLKPLNLFVYRAGTSPPAFSSRTFDARQLAWADLRGKVVVVNFFASWCAECRPEMPAFERLHRDYAARGLRVIGVNARESKDAIARFAQTLNLTFPLLLDADGRINAQYGVIALPTTFVIARDGRAIAMATGAREWAGGPARALIDALLAEPAPASP
jgi:peroxiredoxin